MIVPMFDALCARCGKGKSQHRPMYANDAFGACPQSEPAGSTTAEESDAAGRAHLGDPEC